MSKIDTSLIYILPVRGFLIFGDVRVEFLIISNGLEKMYPYKQRNCFWKGSCVFLKRD